MRLILDHINGVRDDHRIENLRIVCPNCAATLDTHCGRKNRIAPTEKSCEHCGNSYRPRYAQQRYCSQKCGVRWDRTKVRGQGKPDKRKVERPPRDQLLAELDATNYSAVGRKYGVSDNAIRKWVALYERQVDVDDDQGSSEAEAA